ncbi:MucR family transcriptional regulator (plasmid) [Methylobacterium phyllosphaerae]
MGYPTHRIDTALREFGQGSKTGSIQLAADLVSAYVSNNSLPLTELPALIASVHTALNDIVSGARRASADEEVQKPTPAQIRKSVQDDGIVSFIDGRTYKTLRRHLSAYGLHPQSYRQRYGLPVDYPMVAPSYAEQRSAIAKAIGLGRVAGKAA